MEKENDVQLIRKVLSGDDDAFSPLVEKYQKRMHALAWRKVNDFHYAEEIVQDAFLEAYEKLPTLKDHRRFSGWLYVITSRCCVNWLRKNRSITQSLERTPGQEIAKLSYEHYLSEQHNVETSERSEALVRALLNKLPESERTVVMLYYLSEMTTKEIGKFLGVSANTITSRLQRARKRLEKHEELLIREILGSFQLPPNLTENIMRQVADMKPIPPSVGKSLTPWIAFGTATLLITLMLGATNQYLARFQKPYSFEARSERTVEIIDAPITLDTDSKPALRNQAGRVAIPSENSGVGLQDSENVLAPNTQKHPIRPSITQWNQVSGPQGSHISEIFVTSDRTLYTATASGIYNRAADAIAWTLVNTQVPTGNFPMPMAAYNDTLYIVSKDEVFDSTDNGETWNALGSRPKGEAIGLIITDAAHRSNSQRNVSMHLALRDKGIFRSTDSGKQWKHLDNGLKNKSIYAVDAIENTVFAGTNDGVYRLNSDIWEQLSLDTSNAVHALAVMENNLYVATGPHPFGLGLSKTEGKYATQRITGDAARPWKIFHSGDSGVSWTEITPKNKPSIMAGPRSVKILAVGKTLLVLDGGLSFRSSDNGQTWADIGFDGSLIKQNIFTTAMVDENTFYLAGALGVHRTINGGDSWHPFMDGMIGTRIRSLTAFNNKLYAYTGSHVVQSIDDGEAWKRITVDANEDELESIGQKNSHVDFPFKAKLTLVDGGLYGIVPNGNNLRIFHLSTDDNTLTSTQRIPSFDEKTLSTELWTTVAKAEGLNLPDDIEKNEKLMKALQTVATFVIAGGFTSTNETFYVEYQRRLFKWKPGDPEWTNTGLMDLGKQPDEDLQNGFKLAASGETVYVGKREGELFQSLDSGDTWKDITSSLPLPFTHFSEIVFAGSTVYIATDTGVLASQDGENWRVLTDSTDQPVVIDRL
ncbi:MAG: sigma-70 family RNA polymerase sigma factor, partial [Candidatus Poribacteria bacterium]|nr:sigma-70 family RNA polymerase sigma factor [Candidatus Poribacteria bacterium]